MKKQIYLDNNSSTPCDPRVIQVIHETLQEDIGNPSSVHTPGQNLRRKINQARQTIADYFKVIPNEIIFTSSGTEALNMVLRGVFSDKKGHLITSSVEHAAVYNTAQDLCDSTFLSPGLHGAVTPEAVAEAIRPDTRLIALMAANNETGVKTDIKAIALIASEKNIPFLVDGVAILGKEPITLPDGVSAICFSGHKVHAPKGIGLAIIRKPFKIDPFLTGGGQEFSLRSGTENVAGIVGFAKAIEILSSELPQAQEKMKQLRDQLENGITKNLSGVYVNGEGPRIVNTSNLAFDGVDGDALLMRLDQEGIAVSHGSACASGALEPSRILLNMGITRNKALTSLRFSVSRMNTEEEIDKCIEEVTRIVNGLRGKSK